MKTKKMTHYFKSMSSSTSSITSQQPILPKTKKNNTFKCSTNSNLPVSTNVKDKFYQWENVSNFTSFCVASCKWRKKHAFFSTLNHLNDRLFLQCNRSFCQAMKCLQISLFSFSLLQLNVKIDFLTWSRINISFLILRLSLFYNFAWSFCSAMKC